MSVVVSLCDQLNANSGWKYQALFGTTREAQGIPSSSHALRVIDDSMVKGMGKGEGFRLSGSRLQNT